MKRFICLFLTFAALLTSSAYAETPSAGITPSVAAPSAVLMEKRTGEVLYEKKAHDHYFPASVTKVMTLLLIAEDIESGKISLDDTVTASKRAASFGAAAYISPKANR